jgi:hypothetical protein
MVDKTVTRTSLYYSNRQRRKIKTIVFRDGKEQKGRIIVLANGSKLMINIGLSKLI